MIEMRRSQFSFGDGLIAPEVSDLRDQRTEAADQVLGDEEIVTAVCAALVPIPRAVAAAAWALRPRWCAPTGPQARAQLGPTALAAVLCISGKRRATHLQAFRP